METIIHKIRLFDIQDAPAFEHWVKNTDYPTCPDLPSVRSFDVHHVSSDAAAPFHYVEIIKVVNRADFNKDMETASFASLVATFTTMAEVVEEISGTQLGSGYRKGN